MSYVQYTSYRYNIVITLYVYSKYAVYVLKRNIVVVIFFFFKFFLTENKNVCPYAYAINGKRI
jgi:hypothetical protein